MAFKMRGFSPFTQKENEDEKEKKYNIVIKYDDKGNMIHPRDWDPNYKSEWQEAMEKMENLPKSKTKDGWTTIKRKKN